MSGARLTRTPASVSDRPDLTPPARTASGCWVIDLRSAIVVDATDGGISAAGRLVDYLSDEATPAQTRVVEVEDWRVTAAVTPAHSEGPRAAGLLVEALGDGWQLVVLMPPSRSPAKDDPLTLFPFAATREVLPFVGALLAPGNSLPKRLDRIRPRAAAGLLVLRRQVEDPSQWPSDANLAGFAGSAMSAWAQVLRWGSCGAGPVAAEGMWSRRIPPLLRSSEGGDLLGWMEAGFTDLDEVADWLRSGVTHPSRAKILTAKGLTAHEAREWVLSPFPPNSSLIAPEARDRGWTPGWATVVGRVVGQRTVEEGGTFHYKTREARAAVWRELRAWDKVCSPRQARDLVLAGFSVAGTKRVVAETGALPDEAAVQTLIALRTGRSTSSI